MTSWSRAKSTFPAAQDRDHLPAAPRLHPAGQERGDGGGAGALDEQLRSLEQIAHGDVDLLVGYDQQVVDVAPHGLHDQGARPRGPQAVGDARPTRDLEGPPGRDRVVDQPSGRALDALPRAIVSPWLRETVWRGFE